MKQNFLVFTKNISKTCLFKFKMLKVHFKTRAWSKKMKKLVIIRYILDYN